MTVKNILEISPKHSLLIVKNVDSVDENFKRQILNYLKQGIKVYLFLDKKIKLDDVKVYEDHWLLQVFSKEEKESSAFLEELWIADGRFNEEEKKVLEKLAEKHPYFNLEQYAVEHAPVDVHLSVEAGAGTGKTTVMVQRILFLLHTTDIKLKEISMITFTREAAQNMFHRLRKEFHSRFKATKQARYLEYIEELGSMRISTIHSFAKYLIRELGAVLGYGQNVQIRKFGVERKRIIEKYLDEHLAEWMKNHEVSEKLKGIPLYKIVNLIVSYWVEMENKGFTQEEIEQMYWGEAREESADLHDIFSSVFKVCEARFQALKERSNAVSLSDLTRQIDVISRNGGQFKTISHPIRYLFIDEFQDTDDSQIRLAVSLQHALKANLFVVGDTKQSIYRFRGADYTAFSRLRKGMENLGEGLHSYTLRKNYRTSAPLLARLDRFFYDWGRKEYLTYTSADRLIGVKEAETQDYFWMPEVKCKSDSAKMAEHTVNLIQQAKNTLDNPKKQKIAVLVRTNRQARRVQQWCEEAQIYTQLEIGGTFFISDAVQDFSYLISALLYPENPLSRLNLLMTPYSSVRIDWTQLAVLDGDKEKLNRLLDTHPPHEKWEDFMKDLRLKPVLSVLRDIIRETKPFDAYFLHQMSVLEEQSPENPENEAEAKRRTRQYQKNLNHLMEMLHQQFSADFITLYAIHQWLTLNKATNREEDEPEFDEEEKGDRVRIITVHKSKGLEFHTVIIPFAEREFRYETSEILFDKDGSGQVKAGWQIKERGGQRYGSDYFDELTGEEDDEVLKEETRLLYVAMTRSEQRLWIIKNKKYIRPDKKNWLYLLS